MAEKLKAEKQKVSQKTLSLWEEAPGEIPRDVAAQVEKLLKEKGSDLLDQLAFPPVESEVHSLPNDLFELMWKDAPQEGPPSNG